jgi:pyruvate formate lyase activating enzyme
MSTTEVMEALCKDSAYYRKSGGGVTLSGGEPLAQIDFATAILKRCFALNMHTAVETAGYLPWECFQTISPYTDLFLFDIKHMDEKAHKRGTGVSNRSILENLEKLSGIVGEIIVRIPLIPGFNTNKENLHKTAEFISGIGIACVELLPFHHFGREKYRRFGREYPLGDRPSLYGEKGEVVLLAEDIFRRYGVDILD